VIINPTRMRPTEWADRMALGLWQFGPVPRMSRDEDWKEWARAVLTLPGVADQQPPNPDQFENFEEWATYFTDAVTTGA
jgi:hypothetical protein